MTDFVALQPTKWANDLAKRVVKASVRFHGEEHLPNDGPVVFFANRYSRLEFFLLPSLMRQLNGLEPGVLVPRKTLSGRIGAYLCEHGILLPDANPELRMVTNLLRGDRPWMLFSGGPDTLDNRTAADAAGNGAPQSCVRALLPALAAEHCRRRLREQHSEDQALAFPPFINTVQVPRSEETAIRELLIVPTNITYFPIRPRANPILRMARWLARNPAGKPQEDIDVSGTALAEDVYVDIRFGAPIRAARYLCDGPGERRRDEPHSLESLIQPACRLAKDAILAVSSLTAINLDHLLFGLFRNLPRFSLFTERSCRERVFHATMKAEQAGLHLRPGLNQEAMHLLYDEPHAAFDRSLKTLVSSGLVRREGTGAYRSACTVERRKTFPEQWLPQKQVFGLESSAPPLLDGILRNTALLPGMIVRKNLRHALLREDRRLFEYQYARHYRREECKPPEVGAPFLLCPWRVRAGVVLAHGYTAAPLEVRALAQYLFRKGFAVYGVRIEGHGTAPEDLAKRSWREWYAALNRGYAVMRTITKNIFLGGFSTGGCLALVGAARKQDRIQGVFSICAPWHVRSYSIRLVPSIMSVNTLFKRLGQPQYAWEYVENNPENKHINYFRNPMTGIRQLTAVIDAMEKELPRIDIPALIVQASKDTTVNPVSGSLIFEKLASRQKQLVMLERNRHGIINGSGSEEVCSIVADFLRRVMSDAGHDGAPSRGRRFALYPRRFSTNAEPSAAREPAPPPEDASV